MRRCLSDRETLFHLVHTGRIAASVAHGYLGHAFLPSPSHEDPDRSEGADVAEFGGQHHALEVSRIGYVQGLGDGEAVLWRWDVRGRWEA